MFLNLFFIENLVGYILYFLLKIIHQKKIIYFIVMFFWI